MQIIGFNFTKIHAEKSPDFKATGRNYIIEFTNLEREEIDLLKNSEAVNLFFRYNLTYEDQPAEKEQKENKGTKNNKDKAEETSKSEIQNKNKHGEVSFEGRVKITATKPEAEEFEKAWKDKKIPQSSIVPINNFILKRCSIKSVLLHDEIGLPDPHLRIPQLQPGQTQEKI
jgi:hypothetical protein